MHGDGIYGQSQTTIRPDSSIEAKGEDGEPAPIKSLRKMPNLIPVIRLTASLSEAPVLIGKCSTQHPRL